MSAYNPTEIYDIVTCSLYTSGSLIQRRSRWNAENVDKYLMAW